MTVDLSVLESLGINLYSNAAAVLTELVANSYDADATRVKIDWKQQGERIVVSDNGKGMSRAELNDRFLKVGYKKRQAEGGNSARWGRPYMGRKGIGKLSVFSVSKNVSVFSSTKDGASNGLCIKVADLEAAINAGGTYYPAAIDVPPAFAVQGTFIVLDDLKSKRANLTAAALRKRLARRFDVLTDAPEAKGGFYIEVNDDPITYKDRQELKKLEFIWQFGSTYLPAEALPTGITRFTTESDVVDEDQGWKVSGWIGTAKRPTDLTDDIDSGSLKNIIVLARKRPIQEGIVEKLDFSRIFGNYVTGQIEADFLDLDGDYEDIATSDRQRLIEDDDRVLKLQKFLRNAFVKAADQWSKARPEKEAKDVLARYPKLKEWVNERPEWQKEAALTMIGTIASIELEKGDDEKNREALFRAGVLAFARLGLRKVSSDLNNLSTVSATDLLPLLGQQEAYEAGMWVDILRSRVEAIQQFRNLAKADEKEKVLQKHLFNHLWLLDAAWERATASPRMEEDLRQVEPGIFAADAEGNKIAGRLDIRYATAGGRHVIVELKRYSVHPDVSILTEQGLKYYAALRSILAKQNRGSEEIEIIFVLGQAPKTAGAGKLTPARFMQISFEPFDGRYVLYDELIENAMRQYEDYLNASDRARELDELLSIFDGSGDAPPTTG
ncbi:MAG: BbrUII/HgiDII family restriction enzyme [Candidatus Dormibacteria bacterium]